MLCGISGCLYNDYPVVFVSGFANTMCNGVPGRVDIFGTEVLGKGIGKMLDDEELIIEDSISEDLILLSDILAEVLHVKWMTRQLAYGWRRGDVRDDNLKKHPCLVPFSELPSEEKDYYYRSSKETLRIINSQGYKISKI